MSQAVKVGFVSLGCPKNQLDAEVMLHELYDAGFEIVSEDIDADVVIVNTCAFIESAKQESIDNIIDIGWLKKNRQLKGIVVTGLPCRALPRRYFRRAARGRRRARRRQHTRYRQSGEVGGKGQTLFVLP